jgi:hypothetical protein
MSPQSNPYRKSRIIKLFKGLKIIIKKKKGNKMSETYVENLSIAECYHLLDEFNRDFTFSTFKGHDVYTLSIKATIGLALEENIVQIYVLDDKVDCYNDKGIKFELTHEKYKEYMENNHTWLVNKKLKSRSKKIFDYLVSLAKDIPHEKGLRLMCGMMGINRHSLRKLINHGN